WLSDKTIIVILVFTFWARTNAARKGVPSAPLMTPEMLPPGAAYPREVIHNAARPTKSVFFMVISTQSITQRHIPGDNSKGGGRVSSAAALRTAKLITPSPRWGQNTLALKCPGSQDYQSNSPISRRECAG